MLPESIIALAGLVALTTYYWGVLLLDRDKKKIRRWLISWGGRGLVLPILCWIICNAGNSPIIPPFVERVLLGQVTGWLGRMLALIPPGILIISSYWAAITFAWLLGKLLIQAEQPRDIIAIILVWMVFMLLPFWAIFHYGGWLAAGFAALFVLVPTVHNAGIYVPEKQPTPLYTRAIAKMKFGKYTDAEKEVINELEKFEDDFNGWLLLADIYVTHFHDLPEAEQTIHQLIDQPSTNGTQLSIALHRLADWHVKAQNYSAARAALQEICKRLRGTHLAHMAQLRINQLLAEDAAVSADTPKHQVRLPVLRENDPEPNLSGSLKVAASEATTSANELVRKLEQDPNNIPAREKLARILVEQLSQPETGIEQLELLLGLPDQPDAKMAEWLETIATWHLAHRQDWDSAKKALQQIISNYPRLPEAFAAQRRIYLFEMDAKLRKLNVQHQPIPAASNASVI